MPWHAVMCGQHFRGEQPVGAVATGMARIDLGQFCEPVPERLHGRLLLWGNNGDTVMQTIGDEDMEWTAADEREARTKSAEAKRKKEDKENILSLINDDVINNIRCRECGNNVDKAVILERTLKNISVVEFAKSRLQDDYLCLNCVIKILELFT